MQFNILFCLNFGVHFNTLAAFAACSNEKAVKAPGSRCDLIALGWRKKEYHTPKPPKISIFYCLIAWNTLVHSRSSTSKTQNFLSLRSKSFCRLNFRQRSVRLPVRLTPTGNKRKAAVPKAASETVRCSTLASLSQTEIYYYALVKVYETSKYLLLFTSKAKAFIVDKSTIENGAVDEVRGKISAVLKEKYYICSY